GSTLLQTQLQRRWLPIANLCRNIENELIEYGFSLSELVSANAYLTPAHAQGFGIHYDNHCALVIQLHGRKRWEVFSSPEKLPIKRCREAISREHLPTPLLEVDLVRGDVLYIPRGFPHVASTREDSSLHLTLNLRTMIWAEVIAELCESHVSFRRSVQPTTTGSASAAEYFERELVPEIARLNLATYLQRRISTCLAALPPFPHDRFDAIDKVAAITADTHVRRASRSACMSIKEDDQVVLRFPGAVLRLPEAMTPVFDFIARAEVFTPKDLPPIPASYDAVQLTQLLVQHGLVRPVANEQPLIHISVGSDLDEMVVIPPQESHLSPDPPARSKMIDLTLLHGESPSTTPHLDWLRCRDRLTDADCDDIISTCLEFPLTPPTTVDEEQYPNHRRAHSRKVTLSGKTRWLYELLCDVAAEATRTNFHLKLTGITRHPQYVEYSPGRGHFARHNDYSHDQADSPRKLTIIIQLSAPEDYRGGRLQTFGVDVTDLPQERGSILIIPSFVYHCVTPVTQGIRRALVSWIAGPRLC
ncbi:MAG: JmjC domain-containing protein, partial [Pseudonocardiaceae bacterium]